MSWSPPQSCRQDLSMWLNYIVHLQYHPAVQKSVTLCALMKTLQFQLIRPNKIALLVTGRAFFTYTMQSVDALTMPGLSAKDVIMSRSAWCSIKTLNSFINNDCTKAAQDGYKSYLKVRHTEHCCEGQFSISLSQIKIFTWNFVVIIKVSKEWITGDLVYILVGLPELILMYLM